MGSKQSVEVKKPIEPKPVNNNIIFPKEINIYSLEITVLLSIICIIKIIEVIMSVHKLITKRRQRKMEEREHSEIPTPTFLSKFTNEK